jgi:drug/metabolite transporter (DMT)-like permease
LLQRIVVDCILGAPPNSLQARSVITRTTVRRAVGALLVVAGALLMWLAPGPTFTSLSGVGLALLLAGIVLELAGIALERRAEDRRLPGSPKS